MFRNYGYSLIIIILTLLLNACTPNRFEVDTNSINLPEISLKKLHNDLLLINENNVIAETEKLKATYGNFYERYIMSFINRNGIRDSLYASSILKFIHDKDISECRKEILNIYHDSELSHLTYELNQSVKRFHYFFPKKALPKQIVTCQSGWNYATAYTDSTLVVSLDMYLGANSIFYQMLNLQQYRTRCMNAAYILTDAMQGWLLTEFDNDVPVNTLIHHSIFHGKIFFATKTLAPHIEDSIILHYSSKQMDYCKTYEKNLWGYMAEKNRLYENNMRTVQELTGEGPFTAAISKDCPPGIAKYIGWQIVKAYMKNNEKVSLEELMNEKDAQKILSKSKYRP
jgi:hypothetical protein